MKASSLRVRLLLGGALWILLALVLTGMAILYLFVSTAERTVRADLEAGAALLTALIDPSAAGVQLTGQPPDPRYDLPFSGFYWQIDGIDERGGDEVIRSRSLWDSTIPYDPPPRPRGPVHFTAAGPEGQSLSAMALDVKFQVEEGTRAYRIIVAQDRAVLDQSIARFGRDMVIALLVLGLALVLAAIAQVSLGLRPLRALRRDVETVRRGESHALDAGYPVEVQPLVREMNALLASQQRLIEFARTRAADLAHGLKTPLAVLGTVSDQFRAQGDDENADLIDDLAAEMGERIDYQLRLSRLRQRGRGQTLDTGLDEVLARIVAVVSRTARGERLAWQVDCDEGLRLDIDRNDLVELLGILLENAAEWAAQEVRIQCRREGGLARLLIADDSGKLTATDLDVLSSAPPRLDQRGRGNGLGLGIAKEIVALNGGRMGFALSSQNGLQVETLLPLAV
ncbi:MAG: HAMP domain-containing sensor histidine kinase [Paracoccus sp. (in: a-proteobacteria)]|uniref:sensor histidine kinase n=1 Tax=Paracoccus sp. TaxID=267 RepID=UPI0039E4E601